MLISKKTEYLCSTALIYSIFDLIFPIISVTAAEYISFMTQDGNLLIKHLNNNGKTHKNYFRFLAYIYLNTISSSDQTARKYLFGQRSIFSQVVSASCNLFQTYINYHRNLQQMGSQTPPLQSLNDPQWLRQRSGVSRSAIHFNSNSQSSQKPYLGLIDDSDEWFFMRWYHRWNIKRSQTRRRYRAEARALSITVEVTLAVQSLSKFLFLLGQEDKIGYGQVEVEKILDCFISIQKVLNSAVNYGWITKAQGGNWGAKYPEKWTLITKRTVDEAINRLISRYGPQLDFGKLSDKNVFVARHLSGRRI